MTPSKVICYMNIKKLQK